MERSGNGSKMSLISERDERTEKQSRDLRAEDFMRGREFASNERTRNISGNASQISMVTKIGGVKKSPMKKVSKTEYNVRMTDKTCSKSLFSGHMTKGI